MNNPLSATRKKTGGRAAGTPNKPKPAPGTLRQASGAAGAAGDLLTPRGRAREAFPAYKLAKVDTLVPYANNARTHSAAQISKIAASLKEFGFTNPVLTDGKRGIIAGHGRVLAAQQIGMDVVPTIELSHLSAAQRRAYVLADNRLTLDAGWDDELLALELGALRDDEFDLSLTGFDGLELDKLLGTEGSTEPDDQPDESALDGKVCCPGCGYEFKTVSKAFRLMASRT